MSNQRNNQPAQDQEQPQEVEADEQQHGRRNRPGSDDGQSQNPSDVGRSGRSVVHPESDTDDESDDETAGRDPM